IAQQRYEQEEANHMLGLAYGAVAAVAGGSLWALFGIWTQRIYVVIALGVGLLVAWSYKLGARKLDRFGQIAGAALTVAGVVFGEVIFYAWQVSQLQPDIGFRLDAGALAFVKMLRESPGDIIVSLIFGAFGAFVAVKGLRRPRFTPRIVTPEAAVASKQRDKAA